MAAYHVDNGLGGTQQNLSTSYKTLLEGVANTTGITRWWIFGFNIGPSGLPSSTDCEIVWDISRLTATGTGTAVTSLPLDAADAASNATWKANDTIEPTVTATSSLAYGAQNQRATYSWQTNDQSQMLAFPATNAAGGCIRAKSSTYTNTMGATIFFRS